MTDLTKLLSLVSPVRPRPVTMAPNILMHLSDLRGGRQSALNLVRQLQGRPGIRKLDVEQILGHLPGDQMIDPRNMEGLIQKPRYYTQAGANRANSNPAFNEDMAREFANDMLYDDSFDQKQRLIVFISMLDGLHTNGLLRGDEYERIRSKLDEIGHLLGDDLMQTPLANHRRATKLFGEVREAIIDPMTAHPDLWPPRPGEYEGSARWTPEELDMARYREDHLTESLWNDQDLYNSAYQAAVESYPDVARPLFHPTWQGVQRLEGMDPDSYFENVLRVGPQRSRELGLPHAARGTSLEAPGYHFDNEGQLGHIRGYVDPKSKSMILNEMQTDPYQYFSSNVRGGKQMLKDMPEFQDIYGKLGRMAIDNAAKAGLNEVMFPTGQLISSLRGPQYADAMHDIYDKRLMKELYGPLFAKGFQPNMTDPNFIGLRIPESHRLRIQAGDDTLLGYKRGGLAQLRG